MDSSAFFSPFSRWIDLLNLNFKLNSFIFRSLDVKLPSQNRIFDKKRPFTRDFHKDLPFGKERGSSD